MKRFMHFEENEDGTMTVSGCFDGNEEISALIPIGFDGLLGLIQPGQSVDEFGDAMRENTILIPNGAPIE